MSERKQHKRSISGQTTLEYLLILAVVVVFAGVAGKGLNTAVGKVYIPLPKWVVD